MAPKAEAAHSCHKTTWEPLSPAPGFALPLEVLPTLIIRILIQSRGRQNKIFHEVDAVVASHT